MTFKVRRPVTIALRGLRRGKVVATSGLRRFRGAGSGRLTLLLDRRRWPTSLRFYSPDATTRVAPASVPAAAEPPR